MVGTNIAKDQPKTSMKKFVCMIFWCCWFNSSLGAHFCLKYFSVYLIAVCSCSNESHPGRRTENRTLPYVGTL
jgi:hypothetical protein